MNVGINEINWTIRGRSLPEITVHINKPEEVLCIRGDTSFLIAGKVNSAFPLCIETRDEEYCQFLDDSDIVVVSAPDGGSMAAAFMLLELVRIHHVPLIVLPPDHPGSKRLRYVVSAGPSVVLNCTIRRGTHPEQHLICSSRELAGIQLTGIFSDIVIENLPSHTVVEVIDTVEFDTSTT